MDWTFWLEWFIKAVIMSLVILLTGFAYLTLYERRALARIQTRIGPNRAGPQGLLQPIADAVKLIFKEEFTPGRADKLIFVIAPVVTVVPAMILAAVIPLGTQFTLPFVNRPIHLYIANINVGVLYLTAIASIAVYGIVLAGWSSNNKYALLGGMRSTAQMISYELALGLCFVMAILLGNSMSLVDIVEAQKNMWFVVLQPVGALIFMVTTLAEVNRAPFDMPEAEQELAAGYHSEYSGMKFALFFMAEYSEDDRHLHDRRHVVLRRLSRVLVPEGHPPERGCNLAPGSLVVHRLVPWPALPADQGDRSSVLHDLDPRHLAAHPLRPPDDLRLEGAAAAFDGRGGHDGVRNSAGATSSAPSIFGSSRSSRFLRA